MDTEIYDEGILKIQARITLEMKKLEILQSMRDLPHVRCAYLNFETVDFVLPYNLTMLNEASEWLKDRGWEEYYRLYVPSGVLIVAYSHSDFDVPVELKLNTHYEGSTCKLNKIGETVSPIFETVCLEA